MNILFVDLHCVLDLWARKEAWQPSAVHNVSAHHHVICQSPAVLLHRGIQQVRHLPTGVLCMNTQVCYV